MAQLRELDPQPAKKAARASCSSAGAWRTSVPYQFWVAYQKAHRNAAATQRVLTAAAGHHGIDQRDLSPTKLLRIRDQLIANAKIAAVWRTPPQPTPRGAETAGRRLTYAPDTPTPGHRSGGRALASCEAQGVKYYPLDGGR